MPSVPNILAVLAVAGALGFGQETRAAEPPPPAPGKIVSTVCARCHDVDSRGGWSPRPDAPGFAQVARENPEYVEGVLLRPPRAMWGVHIDAADQAEIRAYFAHLRALEAAAPDAGR